VTEADGTLQPVGPFDQAIVAALSQACFGDLHWSRTAVAEVLAMPGAFGFMAWVRGAPVGFVLARVAADECEILSLGVERARRRRGLGCRLLRRALEQAAAMGCRAAYLEVGEDNEAARKLYDTAGFEKVGRRPRYYRRPCGGESAALVFRLELTKG
jgi:ribosomal-protein-alanine N-acetyltransferase